MKSEQEINNRIKELKEKEQQALEEEDFDCALRINAIVKSLMWVLED